MKLIAFDLDGTIANTLADLGNAMNFALQSQGLPTYPVEDYRHFVGNGIDNLVKVTMADAYTVEGAAKVKEGFTAYYSRHYLDFTEAYEGMGELLSGLSDSGYLTAVISNKPDAFVPKILERLYPDHRFVYAWGQREGIPRKPAPDALLKVMELCGTEPADVLYVGDSNVDVIFAHNAGVKVCGVSWGFRGAEELRQAGADRIIDAADELIAVIGEEL